MPLDVAIAITAAISGSTTYLLGNWRQSLTWALLGFSQLTRKRLKSLLQTEELVLCHLSFPLDVAIAITAPICGSTNRN
ncbi:hypothetical protein [Oscillatoria sp. HE19RPO]|uniref:hypothetical protein n=1 Tax=Oscillatoria sp. HE19RPO TaxID=2954806 RepID=UPI0020C2B6EB|nr:hypothetical protein [Oscillatoria sp. HE19RPO]